MHGESPLAVLVSLFIALFSAALALFSLALFGLLLLGVSLPGTPLFGPIPSLWTRLAFNFALWLLFGVQHSVMARSPFKNWLQRVAPFLSERTLYVLLSALVTLALVLLWQPLGESIWKLHPPLSLLADGIGVLGFLLALISSSLIDGLELVGLRRPLLALKGRAYQIPPLVTPLFYRVIRHPIQAGVILLLWGTAHMSADRLFMAVCGTVYILIALPLEERDLETVHGDSYRSYRERVPRLIPRIRRGN
jgi:protein-S-isoprenylcysteine O-methyltransferase Ste14